MVSRYVTLSNIQSNASEGLLGNTKFVSAGAVLPSAAESTDANQCSFASVYRFARSVVDPTLLSLLTFPPPLSV